MTLGVMEKWVWGPRGHPCVRKGRGLGSEAPGIAGPGVPPGFSVLRVLTTVEAPATWNSQGRWGGAVTG